MHLKESLCTFFEYSLYFLETFLSKAFGLQWPPVVSRENLRRLKILTQRQMSTSVIEVSCRCAWRWPVGGKHEKVDVDN